MKRLQVSLWQLINVLFVGFATSVNAEENTLNMTRGVTGISNEVYDLHMLIFYICCAIAVVVFGAMFYSMYHHRKSKGAVAANFHESTKVEVIWMNFVSPLLQ